MADGDPLCAFNDIIEKNNIKLKQFIKNKIISINITDKIKNSLSDLFTEKYLIYPKFLFYWDIQLLYATITGGVDKIITFEELSLEIPSLLVKRSKYIYYSNYFCAVIM